MEIVLGINRHNGQKIVWNSEKVVNRHIIITGESGSGKTFTLRALIHGLATSKHHIKCYVFDVHSDIDTDERITSTIFFGESSEYGLQPLEVSADKDFGGVRRAIKNFLKAFDSMGSNRMGDIQKNTLETMLFGLYEEFGFYVDKPETWTVDMDPRINPKFKKRQPTVKDLIQYMKNKISESKLGINNSTTERLKELAKTIKKIKNLRKQIAQDYTIEEEEKFIEAKNKAVDAFTSCLDDKWDLESVDDFLENIDENQIRNVLKRIENLYRSGIFKEKEFDFDPTKPVQRFDIRALDVDEKKFFVALMLNKIYKEEKAKGETSDFRCSIILDEAKDYSSEKENLVNTIALEGRKFGMQLVLAGQEFGQFERETIAQCATKIILGVDTMFYESSKRKLNVQKELFEKIIPRKNILVNIKNKEEISDTFIEVLISNQ